MEFFLSIIFESSNFGFEISIPCSSRPTCIWWNLYEESKRDFDGMHPTFKHVPPSFTLLSSVESNSIHAVFCPSCALLIAATYPPGPPPITITSKSIYIPNIIDSGDSRDSFIFTKNDTASLPSSNLWS